MRTWILATLFCVLGTVGALGSTVTGNAIDIIGTAQASLRLIFDPQSTPTFDDSDSLIITQPRGAVTDALGDFSVVLKAGNYKVKVNNVTYFLIDVPNDAITYNIRDLVTSDTAYTYTFPSHLGTATGIDIIGADGLTASGGPRNFYSYNYGVSTNDLVTLPFLRITDTGYDAVADGNGAGTGTDNAAAIQSALDDANTAGGGWVYVPDGVFQVDSGLIMYSNTKLTGPGTIEFNLTAGEAYGITALGTLGSLLLLDGDTVAGATTIPLAATTGLSTNDFVRITDDRASNNYGTEIRKIKAVTAGVSIEVTAPLVLGYKTAVGYAADVGEISGLANVTIDGVTFKGLDDNSTDCKYLIDIRYGRNIRIENCVFSHHSYTTPDTDLITVYVSNCDGVQIVNNTKYGVDSIAGFDEGDSMLVFGCSKAVIRDNKIYDAAFGIAMSMTVGGVVSGNQLDGDVATTARGIKLQGSHYCTVSDNTVTGFDIGIKHQDGGYNTFHGNKVLFCDKGIYCDDNQVDLDGDFVGLIITNNELLGNAVSLSNGINLATDAQNKYSIVADNIVEAYESGISVAASDCRITGNVMLECGTSDGVGYGLIFQPSYTVVKDNYVYHTTAAVDSYRIVASPTPAYVGSVFVDNTAPNNAVYASPWTSIEIFDYESISRRRGTTTLTTTTKLNQIDNSIDPSASAAGATFTGLAVSPEIRGTQAIGSVVGILAQPDTASTRTGGTMSELDAIRVAPNLDTAGSTITTVRGVHIQDPLSGATTVSTLIGLSIDDLTRGAVNWGIFVNDVPSQFGGPVYTKTGPVYDVKAWGATGDGTTNDRAAIQAALDAAGSAVVYIPAGTYKITTALNLNDLQQIRGDGRGSIIQQATDGEDGLKNATGGRIYHLNIQDINIQNASTASTGIGLNLENVSDSLFTRVKVTRASSSQGFRKGIRIYTPDVSGGAWRNRAYDLEVYTQNNASAIGIDADGYTSYSGANSFKLFGGEIKAESGVGVRIANTTDMVVDGVIFEGLTSIALDLYGTSVANHVTHCRFENSGGVDAIRIDAAATGNFFSFNHLSSFAGSGSKINDGAAGLNTILEPDLSSDGGPYKFVGSANFGRDIPSYTTYGGMPAKYVGVNHLQNNILAGFSSLALDGTRNRRIFFSHNNGDGVTAGQAQVGTGWSTGGTVPLNVVIGGGTAAKFDNSATAGDTRLFLYDVDNATLERVTVGAADSGGAGYKVLRIPN